MNFFSDLFLPNSVSNVKQICLNATILESERSTVFFRSHFGFVIIRSPFLYERSKISTFHSACLDEMIEYYNIKWRYGHGLQMLTQTASLHFKVAPGPCLVRAPSLLVFPSSPILPHVFRVVLFVSAFASEAKTQYQPSSTNRLVLFCCVSPPPIPLVYREMSHVGVEACHPSRFSPSHSDLESPSGLLNSGIFCPSEAMCSEQPSRKQNGLVVTAVCAQEEPVSYAVLLCFSQQRTWDRELVPVGQETL